MNEEKKGVGKRGLIEDIAIVAWAIAVCSIPIVIFVPIFGYAFGVFSLSERESFEFLMGAIAMFFGLVFIGLVFLKPQWWLQRRSEQTK